MPLMRMHGNLSKLLLMIVAAGLFCAETLAQANSDIPAPSSLKTASGNWQLTWSDEFNGTNGSSPDPANWTIVTGGSGWGNDELEYYTSRPE
jgi:hypothetical protein